MTALYIDCQLKAEVERKIKTTNYYLETFATSEESIEKTILYHAAPEMLDALIKLTEEINKEIVIFPSHRFRIAHNNALKVIEKALK